MQSQIRLRTNTASWAGLINTRHAWTLKLSHLHVSQSGTSAAIYIADSSGVFFRNNNLANADNGLLFSVSTGKYFNNFTFDVTTPFTGGTPIGGNNN